MANFSLSDVIIVQSIVIISSVHLICSFNLKQAFPTVKEVHLQPIYLESPLLRPVLPHITYEVAEREREGEGIRAQRYSDRTRRAAG